MSDDLLQLTHNLKFQTIQQLNNTFRTASFYVLYIHMHVYMYMYIVYTCTYIISVGTVGGIII